MKIEQIPVSEIKIDGKNPRKTTEDIDLLSETINDVGLLQPVIIDEKNNLIFGHRRLQAYRQLGIKEIPAIRKNIQDDKEVLKIRLIENCCRRNIPIIQRAEAIVKLKELTGKSNNELSKQIGISERMIYNYLKIVDMPEKMNLALETGQLTFKEILKIRNLPLNMQNSAFYQKLHPPKIRPKDFLRRAGAKTDFGLKTSKSETWQHFLVKALIYKILYDKGKAVTTEYETEGAIADIFNLSENIVYEVQKDVNSEKIKKKIEDFKQFDDVLIIDLDKVPDLDNIYNYITTKFLT